MEYALIYDKNNELYHICKSKIQKYDYIIFNNDKVEVDKTHLGFGLKNEKIYPHFIDAILNKLYLCKNDIGNINLNSLKKSYLIFKHKEDNNIHKNKLYYMDTIDYNRNKRFHIHAERRVIMIFLALFEKDICPNFFLEFINELKNK